METKQLEGLEFLRKNEIKGMKCDFNRPFAFISYSHDEHDAQIVMNVFKKLYEKGYNLWIDTANMPHNEKSWKRAATNALMKKNCVLALYFRSETSMIKDTISKELESVDVMEHIERTIPIDIWQNTDMTADKYRKEIYNSGDEDKAAICDDICECVSVNSNAIRLASDSGNNIDKLVQEIADDLTEGGLSPVVDKSCTASEISCEDNATDNNVQNTAAQTLSKPVAPTEDKNVTLKLTEFLSKFSSSTFKKDSYSKIRLIGYDEYEKYSTQFHIKSAEMVWEFVNKILQEYGIDYIKNMIAKESSLIHPMFLTADGVNKLKEKGDNHKYRQIEIVGLDNFYMCFQHGAYCWVSDGLKPHLKALGFPLEKFGIEYTATDELKVDSNNIAPTCKERAKSGTYDIKIYDSEYNNLKLKEVMLTVFKTVIKQHPNKVDEIVNSLTCISYGNIIGSDTVPTVFKAGEAVEIGNKIISIGTSLNKQSVFKYINNLLSICKEPNEIFSYNESSEKPDIEYTATDGLKVDSNNIEPTVVKGRAKSGTYDIKIYDSEYNNLKLKEVMLTVFKTVIKQHPNKVDEIVNSLACISYGNVIGSDIVPYVFRAGEAVEIDNKVISIGTSLDKESVRRYINKLLSICNESNEILSINSH